ncbi:J domain-containing protein [Paenibacillus koleovorans]|uniref:J domain-containing protein n=1 Tax=Paenibacillus koleovorans TaxID=121608 RepID=UPI000FD80D83|nr:J domain-containing protein [Paenibacillus koleovorans]
MERAKPKRRTKKTKIENHYKTLELRANATAEAIKKKYIELVKKHTPEQDPEKFQQIRRAYETLRDPIKRQEYDLLRKYGDSVEKLMEEAMDLMEQERWGEAEKLLERALTIAPSAIGVQLALCQVLLVRGEWDSFERRMETIFQAAQSPDERQKLLYMKANMLMAVQLPEKALEVMLAMKDEFPDEAVRYHFLLAQIYQVLGRHEDAWKLIDADIPAPGEEEPDDIYLFVAWVNAMIDLDKWNLWGKVQSRVRQFLKRIADPDDRMMVLGVLMTECREFTEVSRFREAEVFVDFAYVVDPKHAIVQALRKEVQECSRIVKELDRMQKDMDLMPLVMLQAMEWFYEEVGDAEEAADFRDGIPPGFIREMEAATEAYAAGIRRLQAKYPLIYRRYKDEWDAKYAEKTAGLNREARRRLR